MSRRPVAHFQCMKASVEDVAIGCIPNTGSQDCHPKDKSTREHYKYDENLQFTFGVFLFTE